MSKAKPTVPELIADINQRLDNLEELMMWRVRADERFRVGQRVRFSRRRHVPRTREDVRGTVLKFDGAYIVDVQWDDRKHPQSLHHGLLSPLGKSK